MYVIISSVLFKFRNDSGLPVCFGVLKLRFLYVVDALLSLSCPATSCFQFSKPTGHDVLGVSQFKPGTGCLLL